MLSRKQMEERILGGESVSYNGRILTNVADLPSDEEVAVSVTEKQAALDRLEAEHDQLGQRIVSLRSDIVTQKALDAKADADARERKRLDAANPPATNPAGAPLNPITTHGSNAPAQTAKTGKAGEKDDEEGAVTFAGRKLSFYRDKLDKSGAKSKADEKKVLSELDGVGDATAEKILTALDEE